MAAGGDTGDRHVNYLLSHAMSVSPGNGHNITDCGLYNNITGPDQFLAF